MTLVERLRAPFCNWSVNGARLNEAADRIEQLETAIWQVLDDMGKDGQCCCKAAKHDLRIAYGETRDADLLDYTLEEALASRAALEAKP
jgi:hypothetical protein